MNELRCIIISQPKAGTYLCANLLQELGLGFEGFHLNENKSHKYKVHELNSLTSLQITKQAKIIKKPLKETLKLIKNNHIAVSHLVYKKETEKILENFKKILLVRDYESSIKSWNRWRMATNRRKDSKNINKEFRDSIEKWKNRKNIFVLNFYDMKNINIQKINELQKFIFQKIVMDSKEIMENALNKPSFTRADGG